MITAITGSITNKTLPGKINAGRIKHIDLPDPVGCTTTKSLPFLITLAQSTQNFLNLFTLRTDVAV